MIPFGYTLSLEKLTKGEWNGRGLSCSIFICWKANEYIMSAKLPLSIRTPRILKFSIFNMITKGSSCGCFTPHESCAEKVIFGSSDLACFVQTSFVCILFIYLMHALLSDLDDPSTTNPPAMVRLSPATICCFSFSCAYGGLLPLSWDRLPTFISPGPIMLITLPHKSL